jgi:membrane glycosyltransferase
MAMGVVAYASALIWAAFLVLSTLAVAEKWFTVPTYFAATHALFPLWPQWRPELALTLLGSTVVLLIFPKLFSVLLIVKERRSAQFGSLGRLLASVVLEILVSTLLAPVRMWFHGKFVLLTLLGRQISWHTQIRTDAETRWRDAMRQHGISTIVALAWLAGLAALSWSLVWWLLPIVAALALSIPMSVYSSRVALGRALRRRRLLTRRPELLTQLAETLDRQREPRPIVSATA